MDDRGCVPKTCAQLGYTCGKNGDGCGGILDCGTCKNQHFCGGGGFNKCGSCPTGQTCGGAGVHGQCGGGVQ